MKLTFGQKLKRVRGGLGVTQRELAKLTGIDASYLSRIETGIITPERETIIRIARALKLSEEERDVLMIAANRIPLRYQKTLLDRPVLFELVRYAATKLTDTQIRAMIK